MFFYSFMFPFCFPPLICSDQYLPHALENGGPMSSFHFTIKQLLPPLPPTPDYTRLHLTSSYLSLPCGPHTFPHFLIKRCHNFSQHNWSREIHSWDLCFVLLCRWWTPQNSSDNQTCGWPGFQDSFSRRDQKSHRNTQSVIAIFNGNINDNIQYSIRQEIWTNPFFSPCLWKKVLGHFFT